MRSVGLAYVLWFFGGVFGVHRFYCERIGTGVLWFFTGGLFGIGWLVDLFLVPSLVEEANANAARELRAIIVSDDAPSIPTPQHAQTAERCVYCTQCGQPMRVPASAGGSSFACPSCRAVLRVPA